MPQPATLRSRLQTLNDQLWDSVCAAWNASVGLVQRADLPTWRRGVGIAFGAIVGLGFIGLAVAAIVALVDLVGLGMKKAGEFTSSVATSPVVDIAVDPIRTWITSHGEGLAAGATGLALTWGLSGGALLLMSALRVRAARFIGWPGFGLATMAMAWDGSLDMHRPIAAGTAGLIWCLLSMVAFRRRMFT